ncbi:MAG TPA: ligase-associated DNA damage response exonuclease [Flavipsychrobacter sp.]|nr:ligase-associated DNA damage response exonuclease [Flavipsychrobacter sp.]
MGLITFTDNGLYCKQGDFYIDPWRPVHRAIITHAHSDHARVGNALYLAHKDSYYLLKARLGQDIAIQTVDYKQTLGINGVNVTLFPAGHIIGSAQIKVEYKGETWVVSGDYKTQDDGITVPFEPVKCNTFITESTFGLPIYQWLPQSQVMDKIHAWVLHNQSISRNSILETYSLGKAQRLIHALLAYGHKFYAHGAIYYMQEAIKQFMSFPEIEYLTPETPKDQVKNGIILVPPSAVNSPWMRRWQPYSLGICSGWMQVRGVQRRRNADAGFALSDHADWKGLLDTIRATEAECVYVTHGFSATLARYLREKYGLKADVVQTAFGEEED